MGGFGAFFKGEKKKKKKGDLSKPISVSQVFVQPEVIKKGKDKW